MTGHHCKLPQQLLLTVFVLKVALAFEIADTDRHVIGDTEYASPYDPSIDNTVNSMLFDLHQDSADQEVNNQQADAIDFDTDWMNAVGDDSSRANDDVTSGVTGTAGGGIDTKRQFQSWAGKRSLASMRNTLINWTRRRYIFPPQYSNKRTFQSWAGKRSAGSVPEQQRATVTGSSSHHMGRRAVVSDGDLPYSELLDTVGLLRSDLKRAFQSWNGKRASMNSGSYYGDTDKRTFQSWNGKRASTDSRSDFDGTDKRAFQSWNGKRASTNSGSDFDGTDKRAFQSWNGKRAADFNTTNDKRAFQSWNGKRGMWIQADDDDVPNKRSFQSWNGKRSAGDPIKIRRSFNPWAGKRSADWSDDVITSGDDNNNDDTDDEHAVASMLKSENAREDDTSGMARIILNTLLRNNIGANTDTGDRGGVGINNQMAYTQRRQQQHSGVEKMDPSVERKRSFSPWSG